MNTPKGIITGASAGFGLALASQLIRDGWQLILTGRNYERLRKAARSLNAPSQVIPVAGDVQDELHLLRLAEEVRRQGWNLDLVVNNASELGPSPMPGLLEMPVRELHRIFHTNTIAPVSLVQKLRTFLKSGARIVNVTSDAGIEAYAHWGGYGGSKAALEYMTAVLQLENPGLNIYAFDPGDMQTELHQRAVPDEDISYLPLPEEWAVPALIRLITSEQPSGRYSANSQNEVHQ